MTKHIKVKDQIGLLLTILTFLAILLIFGGCSSPAMYRYKNYHKQISGANKAEIKSIKADRQYERSGNK